MRSVDKLNMAHQSIVIVALALITNQSRSINVQINGMAITIKSSSE